MTAKKQLLKPELENLLKRLQADFDNYRKRVDQEKIQFTQFANANLLNDLVPVLNNFKRASQNIPENIKNDSWATGVQAIEKQLEEILKRHGIEVIQIKPGDQFNPLLHEALAHQPSPGYQPNSIIKIVENGYQLNGKILRPAKVVVA